MSRKPTVIDHHIGRRVRDRRVFMQLTQEKLAEHLGISFQQLQKYEIGENRISAARLFEIAVALQAEVSWFFDGFIPKLNGDGPRDLTTGVHSPAPAPEHHPYEPKLRRSAESSR